MEATPHPSGATPHEFGPRENEVIGKAGTWIGYWSWIAVISGVVLIIGGIFDATTRIGNFVMGAVYVVVGLYFRGSAQAMSEVVSTAGNDVPHLMSALDKLSSAFKVMVLLFIIGALTAVVAAVIIGLRGPV